MQKETLGHSHNISGHRDHIDTCCTHACLPLQAWVARHDSHPVDHYSVLQDTCAATFRRFSVVCSYHQGDLCRHHYSPSSVFLQNKFYSFRTPVTREYSMLTPTLSCRNLFTFLGTVNC